MNKLYNVYVPVQMHVIHTSNTTETQKQITPKKIISGQIFRGQFIFFQNSTAADDISSLLVSNNPQ
jgi:hypothetical protein